MENPPVTGNGRHLIFCLLLCRLFSSICFARAAMENPPAQYSPVTGNGFHLIDCYFKKFVFEDEDEDAHSIYCSDYRLTNTQQVVQRFLRRVRGSRVTSLKLCCQVGEYCRLPKHAPGNSDDRSRFFERSFLREDCCYAFALVNTIYGDLFPMHEDQVLRQVKASEGSMQEACQGSAQELLDWLHHYDPPPWLLNQTRPIEVPSSGYPHSFRRAFGYVNKYGLYTEKQYPFVGNVQDLLTEPPINIDSKFFVSGFERIDSSRYELVVQQLVKQPLTGSILFHDGFKNWTIDDGIYQGPSQSEMKEIRTYQFHALTLVGYGVEGQDDYYLCRNSYGPNWGYHGYIKVRRRLIKHIFYPVKTYIGNSQGSVKRSPIFGT